MGDGSELWVIYALCTVHGELAGKLPALCCGIHWGTIISEVVVNKSKNICKSAKLKL